MNNDNTNTVVENLEDAAYKFSNDFDDRFSAHIGFKGGAKWKEKELQPLIDSHRELQNALIRINSIADVPTGSTWGAEFSLIKQISESAIQKANNIKP